MTTKFSSKSSLPRLCDLNLTKWFLNFPCRRKMPQSCHRWFWDLWFFTKQKNKRAEEETRERKKKKSFTTSVGDRSRLSTQKQKKRYRSWWGERVCWGWLLTNRHTNWLEEGKQKRRNVPFRYIYASRPVFERFVEKLVAVIYFWKSGRTTVIRCCSLRCPFSFTSTSQLTHRPARARAKVTAALLSWLNEFRLVRISLC